MAPGRRSDEVKAEAEKWVSHSETQAGAPLLPLPLGWLKGAGELVDPYWRSPTAPSSLLILTPSPSVICTNTMVWRQGENERRARA